MSSKPRRPSSDDDQGRFAGGTPIGVCLDAKLQQSVLIPPEMRPMHVRITGSAGTGKTTLMGAMVLDDIRQGAGVAVIDPSGDMVEHVLHHLPSRDIERTVHLRPGERDSVPIWNPLNCGLYMPIARVADALTHAFGAMRASVGDRTEHLLRHALYAILQLPGGHLSDLADLLRRWSPESRRLRRRLDECLDSESAHCFWRENFARYTKAELLSLLIPVSKLLTSGTVGLMLSQPESSFDLRDVMNSSKILLVDLSCVTPEIRSALCSLLLRLLHLTACDQRGEREQSHQCFHIYVEEAGLLAGGIEDLIAEARRFNVSLTLSHQSMYQLSPHQADALAAVGSAIIFRVAAQDAARFEGILLGKARAEDLIGLGVGQSIARIGTRVVRVQIPALPAIPKNHHRDEIIARSRRLYCRPAEKT